MKTIYYFLSCIVLLSSCKTETASELDTQLAEFDQLQEETLEIHDEVMLQLGPLMDLSMDMDKLLEAEDLPPSREVELITAKAYLDLAHDGMMTWMKDYSDSFPFEAEPPATLPALEVTMDLLKSLNQEIKDIKKDTEAALKEATAVLDAPL